MMAWLRRLFGRQDRTVQQRLERYVTLERRQGGW